MILGKRDKLIERLLSRPADFIFTELATLLGRLGYHIVKASKTGGSRVTFANSEGDYLRIHKPHPLNVLKRYQIEDVITALTERGLMQ